MNAHTRNERVKKLIFDNIVNKTTDNVELTVIKGDNINQRLGGLFLAQFRVINTGRLKVNTYVKINKAKGATIIVISKTIKITMKYH